MNLAWLLRSMLANAATQKVRDTVMQAAQERLGEQAEAAAAAAEDRRCDVAVVCALELEAGGLEDRLDGLVTLRGQGFRLRRGRLGERHVAVVVSGIGQAAAAAATEAFLNAYQPQWLISAGFAGGLDEDLPRKHLVVADTVCSPEGQSLPIDLGRFPPELLDLEPVHVGRLLTVDRVISRPAEKRTLGVGHKALAVDMETLAVAEVCRRRGVPFLAVRVVSDAVGDELPPDVDRLVGQKTNAARLGAALSAIVNRPASLKNLFKLHQAALDAGQRLAKYLVRVIRGLPLAES